MGDLRLVFTGRKCDSSLRNGCHHWQCSVLVRAMSGEAGDAGAAGGHLEQLSRFLLLLLSPYWSLAPNRLGRPPHPALRLCLPRAETLAATVAAQAVLMMGLGNGC